MKILALCELSKDDHLHESLQNLEQTQEFGDSFSAFAMPFEKNKIAQAKKNENW